MHILPKNTKKILYLLEKYKIIENFYLAGGTGLALVLKHRISKDLDFFSCEKFLTQEIITDLKKIKNLDIKVELQTKGSLTCSLNQIKTSFFYYPYRLLENLIEKQGIKIAHPIDIGCMKIWAISSRGTKRDFFDLYFISKEIIPLKNLLKKFEEKFRETKFNTIHILKSLQYFEDAQKEPDPKLIKKVKWSYVKKFFEKEVKLIFSNS